MTTYLSLYALIFFKYLNIKSQTLSRTQDNNQERSKHTLHTGRFIPDEHKHEESRDIPSIISLLLSFATQAPYHHILTISKLLFI